MDLKIKDAAALRRYLLGNTSLEEQDEIERWLMSNEDAYDLLEAAEDDLIDDSLAGRLGEADLDRFNNHFLVAPERKNKLQFSRSFKRLIDSAAQPSVLPPRLPHQSSLWPRLLDALRYRPVLGYAFMALMVAVVLGSGWSLVTINELQRTVHSTDTQLANLSQERDELRRQLDETQSANDKLRARFRDLEKAGTSPQPSSISAIPLMLSLLPGLTRSSNDRPKIVIGANNKSAQFSLIVLDDNYSTYRATLLDDNGRELLTRDKLKATNRSDGKAVVVSVPTESLSNGDYSLSLLGITDAGGAENIDRYHFRAVRQ